MVWEREENGGFSPLGHPGNWRSFKKKLIFIVYSKKGGEKKQKSAIAALVSQRTTPVEHSPGKEGDSREAGEERRTSLLSTHASLVS